MNRLLDKSNKKDKFIIDTLLPYLVKHMEESEYDDAVEQIVSMYVFPYKTEQGTRVGSLREPGISWYFSKDDKSDIKSSGSYRVFDLSVLSDNQATEFRKLFREYCDIEEFSDTAVIKDLLEKMSKESEYTKEWWTYAYDVFTLWNVQDFNSSLSKATENMANNSFLFLENTYTRALKDRLIQFNVFEDIKNETSNSEFWNKILKADYEKAIDMLQRMGVPYKFAGKTLINPCIIDFFETISSEVEFPVTMETDEYEICELCQDIMLSLFCNHYDLFAKFISEDESSNGLVIRNINDEFVPLSWSLFYSEKDYMEQEEEENISDNEKEYEITESRMELHHVNAKLYDKKYLSLFREVYEFSEVCEHVEEYSLGIEVEAIEFYKWLWYYSKHIELAQNILFYYSDEEEIYTDADIVFALEVLGTDGVWDEGYAFNFEVNADKAFENCNVLNKLCKNFSDIYCTVKEEGELLDKSLFFPQLTGAINDGSAYQRVLTDSIWDRVFVVDGEPGIYYGKYVVCRDESGDRKIFLWKSGTIDSYVIGLAQYVADFFNVEVNIGDLSEVDWKKAYINLVNGIRSFINYHVDVVPTDEVYKYIADMNDIVTFGEEKALWLRLKEQRRQLVEAQKGDTPFELLDNRNFLKAKYNGRCQICGNIAPKNAQDSYFYTYRIVKKSKNPLADMRYNLFCLCPTCHGELGYGRFMGQDMSDIVEKASMYASYLEDKLISEEMEDEFPCLVQELVDHEVEIEGFHEPIVCNVIVNGKERKMAFSWEHFIKIAFVFSDINDFDEEDDFVYEKVDETEDYDPIPNGHAIPHSVSHPHGYTPWHGTEWVSGHYRTRNGHTEYVSGHWRTR